MGKAVRKPINQGSWQPNSEVAAGDPPVIQYAGNLIQTSPRYFGIDMDKPKNLAARGARAGIHLHGTTALAPDKLIAKACGEISCVIRTAAICNNDLRSRCSPAQVLQKLSDQRSLVYAGHKDARVRLN